MMRARVLSAVVGVLLMISRPAAAQPTPSSDYLFLWTASADSTQPDFLAVLDARATSKRYGRVVKTLPVPGRKNEPHHTEHELAADRRLFANGFDSGQSFVFDLSTPTAPRIVAQFGDVKGLHHPHSFVRLPNGNVLGTFQVQFAPGKTPAHTGHSAHAAPGILPGGLAEITPSGRVVRTASANVKGVNPAIRPYSAAIFPRIDRVLTTTTDMNGTVEVNAVQLWRLSDLTLLSTFDLPNGPRKNEGALTAEPRVLPDGKSALVSTFNCGLHHVTQLDTPKPVATLVASFPQKKGTYCAIPVIVSRYYLVTVPAWNAVVSLDISDPAKPREVSRVSLGAGDVPHWISVEPNHRRVVLTGYGAMAHRVYLLAFDESTGKLTLDARFRDAGATTPAVTFAARRWPHGGTAAATPHGAVFSR